MEFIKRKELSELLGQETTINGKLSDIMWQRIVAPPSSHPTVNYLDLEDGFQIVLYTKEKLKCKNHDIEVTGTVMEIKGGGGPGSKIDNEDYVEYHIKVKSWKCL